jgi:hypothetical protein
VQAHTPEEIALANCATKFCAVEELEECKAEFRGEFGVEPNVAMELTDKRGNPIGRALVSYNRDLAETIPLDVIKANFRFSPSKA